MELDAASRKAAANRAIDTFLHTIREEAAAEPQQLLRTARSIATEAAISYTGC